MNSEEYNKEYNKERSEERSEERNEERDEWIDLFVDDALPEALRARAMQEIAADPALAAEVAALQRVAARLRDVPAERPDTWFAERTLDCLLREHAQAQTPEPETLNR